MALQRGSPEFREEQFRRRRQLKILQEQFPTYADFVPMVMRECFRFGITDMQLDMVQYMQTRERHAMVQMPRGEGKTLITSIIAVHDLIMDPSCRVVVFSGNDEVAREISKFIFQIFQTLEILQFMLPDRRLGDNTSSENFSVCGYLKPMDKSPSVRCRPIFGGYQGIRADKIIADDLEMLSNSATASQREKLQQYIQELESLLDSSKPNQRIQMLGTPQTTDSTYNVLPGLGFDVRIWTARVPTAETIEYYGDQLAPFIRKMYDEHPEWRTGYGLEGDRGKVTDPERYSEEDLLRKEMTQRAGGMFDLQYMLCTKMADADRYPLKLEKCLFMDLPETEAPMHVNTIRSIERLIKPPVGFAVQDAKLYEVMGHSADLAPYESVVIYIDPAGGGSTSRDEVAYSVVKSLNGFVYVDRCNGLQGGYETQNLTHLADVIGYYWSLGLPLTVYCEDNYGNGMFRSLLQGALKNKHIPVEILGDNVSGQKEIRIINVIQPLLDSGKLIFNKELLESDVATRTQYDARSRHTYSLFHQMRYLSSERGALKHDDRIDSLAGALRFFADLIIVNQQEMLDDLERERKIAQYRKMFPHNADEVLEALGLIKNDKAGGTSHLNFGRFRKKRNNGKIHEKFKNPFEKERAERISEQETEYAGDHKGRNGLNFYGKYKGRKR